MESINLFTPELSNVTKKKLFEQPIINLNDYYVKDGKLIIKATSDHGAFFRYLTITIDGDSVTVEENIL